MNSTFQKIIVIVIAILVFVITFVGSSKEQVVVEANKIVTDSNNIDNNYLVGPKWLSQNLDNSNLVILDIRNKKEYDEAHVPGAINVSLDQFANVSALNQSGEQLNNWTNILNKKQISTELQNLGITENSDVIIYGESNAQSLQELGEISWIFKLVGINSKMLNGGYENWIANGLNAVKEIPSIKKSDIQIENFVQVKTLTKQELTKNLSSIKVIEFINDMDVKNSKDATKSLNTQNANLQGSNVQNNNAQNSNGQNANKAQTNSTQTPNNVVNTSTNNNSNSNSNEVNNPPVNNNANGISNDTLKNVVQIKLSELLNPNGTLKPVDKLDNLFEGKGISPDNNILFYNTNNGDLIFLKLVLEMSGFEKIANYSANLNQILSLEQANINVSNNSNSSNSSNNGTNNNGSASNNLNNNVSTSNNNSNNANASRTNSSNSSQSANTNNQSQNSGQTNN